MRRFLAGWVAAVVVATGALGGAEPGGATQPVPGHLGLVPDAPRTDTPYVDTGEVVDVAVIGSRVYLAGTFTSIRNPGGESVAQPYLAAYDLETGLLDEAFRPTLDRTVAAAEPSPDGSALYVAGKFNYVDGVRRRKVAKLDPVSGAVDVGFKANADAQATALAVSPTTVYVGGHFAKVNGAVAGRLAAVDVSSGAVDPAFDLPLTGGIGAGGVLKVAQLRLTSDESTLLVVHTGRMVDGLDRTGIALVDTATKAVLPWQTSLYADYLPSVGGALRVTNGDISPDNSYFVVVSGAGGDRPPINDTAVAFPMSGEAGVQPLWVSRHFDSLYAVAVTETAVYVGGHFRWQEAPGSTVPWPGDENLNYGWGSPHDATLLGDEVLRRDMIGALDPATGTTVPWNPGCEAFEGVKVIEAVPRGLLVGHDGLACGQRTIGRHAFFDFARVPAPAPAETWLDTPFEGQTVVVNGTVPMVGRAEAPSGVSRVEVELRNRGTGQYLQDDGVTWGPWNAIVAQLESPGGVETPWSLDVTLPAGDFKVWARAFGVDGSKDTTKATAKFVGTLIGDALPSAAILLPAEGLVNSLSFELSGTAADDHGVDSLSFVAKHIETGGYLQDDGTEAPMWSSFPGVPDNPGEANVTWRQELAFPAEGTWDVWVTAIDDAGQSDNRGTRARYSVLATNAAPTATIDTPLKNSIVPPGEPLTITGTAADDTAVQRVDVRVRNLQTREGMATDGAWGVPNWRQVTPVNTSAPSLAWSVTTPPLPPGRYEIIARAVDEFEVATPEGTTRPNIKVLSQYESPPPPETTLDFASTTQDVDDLDLPITGTASGEGGIADVKLVVQDDVTKRYLTNADGDLSDAYTLLAIPVAEPGGTATTFSQLLHLPTAGDWNVTAFAMDTLGQFDMTTTNATARYLIFPGDADPTSVIYAPLDGATVTNTIALSGRAFDDAGIQALQVQVIDLANGKGLRANGTFGVAEWLPTFLTNPGGPESNYVYTSPVLAPGSYRVDVRPTDSVGQVQPIPTSVTVTVVAG